MSDVREVRYRIERWESSTRTVVLIIEDNLSDDRVLNAYATWIAFQTEIVSDTPYGNGYFALRDDCFHGRDILFTGPLEQALDWYRNRYRVWPRPNQLVIDTRKYDVGAALLDLKKKYRVFPSESELVKRLSNRLEEMTSGTLISERRLYMTVADKNLLFDLFSEDGKIAIEVKFPAGKVDTHIPYGQNHIDLYFPEQGHSPYTTHDCLYDALRIEDMVSSGTADFGYVVLYTNKPHLRQPPKVEAVDQEYRLNEDGITGQKKPTLTKRSRQKGNTKENWTAPKRMKTFTLKGIYDPRWWLYSTVIDTGGKRKNRQIKFYALCLQVSGANMLLASKIAQTTQLAEAAGG